MLNCCKLKGESKTRTALTGYLKLKETRENTNYSAPPPPTTVIDKNFIVIIV